MRRVRVRLDELQLPAQRRLELAPCRLRNELARVDTRHQEVAAGEHVGAMQRPRLVAYLEVELVPGRFGACGVAPEHVVAVELATELGRVAELGVQPRDCRALRVMERLVQQNVEVEVDAPTRWSS